jgi:hypothetical protein
MSRLTRCRLLGRDKWGKSIGLYRCTCGNMKRISDTNVLSGVTKSCGCLLREMRHRKGKDAASYRHGYSIGHKLTPEYVVWQAMNQRCNDVNASNFEYYGGRGIKVCKRWKKFINFLTDMGKRPKGKSLDRRNVNGNYTPSNCRWATATEQSRNRRNVIRCM